MGDTMVKVVKACLSFACVKIGLRESRKALPILRRVDFASLWEKTIAKNQWVIDCVHRALHKVGGVYTTAFEVFKGLRTGILGGGP